MPITVVNMIPNSWSDDENQDCEPNLSVNPADPSQITGTAFTYDNPAGMSALSPAMTGNWAPLFYSSDGGLTWTLQFVLPSAAGAILPTFDVTCRYGGTSGEVYSGLISAATSAIVVNRAPNAVTEQTTIASFFGDQPFLEATTAAAVGQDRLYVGYNANNTNSTVDVFLNATAPAPGFTSNALDVRFPSDMPPTRTAIHSDGTIYCAFYSYNSAAIADPASTRNVVVVKDLNWGASAPPFQALIDSIDLQVGVRVATSISNPWWNSNILDPNFGHDRYGPDLAIAVDPNNVQRVYIAYATGTGAADETLHLVWSDTGGQTWFPDVRTVPVAKNPSLAINTLGDVGFVYQQVVGANWMTILEISDNGFVSSFSTHILASTPTNAPPPAFVKTYLGDYVKLQAIGKDFYGTFCASNAPVKSNFPCGVTYQRNVNWATQTLLGNNGVTPVAVSIDPFFFKVRIETPGVATAIANNGFFGDVCLGSFVDEMLTINNHGSGALRIFNITSSLADFEVPNVLSYPLKVEAGVSIDVAIRFRPTILGFRAGKIEIFSNDPASPHVVDVSGICPAPRLVMMIANQGNFGNCCVGSFVDECLILNNSGRCQLSVTEISSSLADFLVPEVITYPLTIGHGNSLPVPIRFAPISHGPKSATITVTSNDPASPISVKVSGDAPPGKIAVGGSTTFGGVNAGCCADRTLSICNTGDCTLHVTSVRFRRKSRHWRLLNNPFPAMLRPGSCLPAVIQYRANEKCPRPCELVIESDDPATPVKFVEVLAYTIWDAGCKEGCDDRRKEDCDDCRKGCCDKHPSCRQGYPCCDDDEDDDEDR